MSPWAQVLVVVATPVLAFLGSVVGHWAHRRSAAELDAWRRREETFRTLRWAAEQIAASYERPRLVGGVVLGELLGSELLQDEDVEMVQAVLQAAATLDHDEQTTYPEGAEIVVVEGGDDG